MKKFVFSVLLICCGSFVCAEASDFQGAVEAVVKKFVSAIAAKDSSAVGSLYATDAIALPPNSEMVKGRDAIATFWKGFMDAGMTATLEIVETQSQGDMGFDLGKYKIMDASGKEIDQGKYVVVWKKTSEGWQLYRDIWNSSVPVPGAK